VVIAGGIELKTPTLHFLNMYEVLVGLKKN
jgi:hypothetical protein